MHEGADAADAVLASVRAAVLAWASASASCPRNRLVPRRNASCDGKRGVLAFLVAHGVYA